MKKILKWLKIHLWAAFLLYQFFVFALAFGFLTSIRKLTGREIHLGRDPLGLIDGLALIFLSVGVIFLTHRFYHFLKSDSAKSLGIAFSFSRLLQMLFGLALGFAFFIAPWVNAVLRGTATITDRIDFHFDKFSAVKILSFALVLLILQAFMEETVNRAFPLRIWEHRSLLFRLFFPSIIFALIHLADEQFNLERFGVLIMAGIIQSFAYLLTENIWFTSGLHAGANIASFSITGLWHAGALVSITGETAIQNWMTTLIILVLISSTFFLKQKFIKNDSVLNFG